MKGKVAAVNDSKTTEGRKGSTSTTATVTAAHKPESAEVKGRIAPARAPWLAYVSDTAAVRDLRATDSTAAASVYSARASE